MPNGTVLRAEALLPQWGSGRVRPGQRARLSFASYPVQDVGFMYGTVEDISLLPRDSVFLVRIGLPDGLVTEYGVALTLQQRMLGVAEIVSGEISVIRRLANRARMIGK